jgi:hypothetical protein
MKPVLLSIVIPSYNGAGRVVDLLNVLNEIIPESIKFEMEVVISDNHSDPQILIPDVSGLTIPVKIVSPSQHLLTAEENLLFAIKNTRGTYCWVIGDDDIPLVNGFNLLFDLVKASDLDLMIFNSLAFNSNSNSWNIHRLDLDRLVTKMPFVDFIKRAGFWSITAGFSTLVFRKETFDLGFMENLHSNDLKIYSHVTTLINSYHDKSFAAIALPLVKYSSNSFDEESTSALQKDEHWVKYAENQNEPYRNPWTVSFIKQIKLLENANIFSMDDLFNVLDQGHLGQRFFLFDQILAFVIDQLLFQKKDSSLKSFAEKDFNFVLDELYGKNPEIDDLIRTLKLLVHSTDEFIKLHEIILKLTSTEEQIQRRLLFKLSGGGVYQTPYGYFWTPLKLDINLFFKSLSTPRGGIHAENLLELEDKISNFAIENPLYPIFDISRSLNVQGLNSQVVKIDKLAKLIPQFLRKRFNA